jgi:hypothetical protein
MLIATNPSTKDHKQAVVEKMNVKIEESPNYNTQNDWQNTGEAIGTVLVEGIVEKAVSRDNYLLFSLTKVSSKGEDKFIGIGIFAKVWFYKEYDKSF